MNPQLALLGCAAFVAAALLFDARKTPNVSRAVWIAVLWAVILASRPVTAWFDSGVSASLMVSQDGTALDRNSLVLLIVTAAVVLARRHLPWGQLAQQHVWILVFFLFCAISIVWSDFPGVGLKRWIRAVGTLMLILVVASEKDPVAAAAAVIRRTAIVLLPFSMVLIKYFRSMGVAYNPWTGTEYLVGVATDKNALGRLCLVFGLFALWEILTRNSNPHLPADRISKLGRLVILGLAIWLLLASNSKTALSCFVLGGVVIAAMGWEPLRARARYLGILTVVVGGLLLVLSLALNLPELILKSLGRDLTLTDRTFIWADLRAMGTNPILGVGYDTFWLGSRLEFFLEKHQVNSAHNGYLDTYLELGGIGVLLLLLLLFSVFSKVKSALLTDVAYGRLLAGTLAVFLVYNITEAGYKPTTLVSFVLLLVTLSAPGLAIAQPARAPGRRGRSRPAPSVARTEPASGVIRRGNRRKQSEISR